MMENSTLSPEQIKNWRQIIALQLEGKLSGAGIYAFIMPEAEVIAYWKHMKGLFETPDVEKKKTIRKPVAKEWKVYNGKFKKACDHSNSIKGSKGRYCLDCEMYV